MANLSPSRVGMVLAGLLFLALLLITVATYLKVRQLDNRPTVLSVSPPVLFPSPDLVASPPASPSAAAKKK